MKRVVYVVPFSFNYKRMKWNERSAWIKWKKGTRRNHERTTYDQQPTAAVRQSELCCCLLFFVSLNSFVPHSIPLKLSETNEQRQRIIKGTKQRFNLMWERRKERSKRITFPSPTSFTNSKIMKRVRFRLIGM